jgi:phosphoribosylamine-glycine ligase
LNIGDEFDHRVQRSFTLTFPQSPAVAEINEGVGDPDTGVGLPNFNIDDGETSEEGNNQSAEPVPIGFGNVCPDQKFVVERNYPIFVRRRASLGAREDSDEFFTVLKPFDFD